MKFANLIAMAILAAAAGTTQAAAQAAPDGQHDFDFNFGTWKIGRAHV